MASKSPLLSDDPPISPSGRDNRYNNGEYQRLGDENESKNEIGQKRRDNNTTPNNNNPQNSPKTDPNMHHLPLAFSPHHSEDNNHFSRLPILFPTDPDPPSIPQSRLQRFLQCEKYICFNFSLIVLFLVCFVGIFLSFIFLPINQPQYSLCNQNIHWGNLLNSIVTQGFMTANVTIHASLYNPNRFDIELKRLYLRVFFRDEIFGYGVVSQDQNIPKIKQVGNSQHLNKFDSLDFDQNGHSTGFVPSANEYIDETNPVLNQIDDLDYTINKHNEENKHESTENITTTTTNNQNNYTKTSLNSPPLIHLTPGNITDVFIDAILSPSLAQAVAMGNSWLNGNLFVSVEVEYDTSVFLWKTPRINYNATGEFKNMNIGGGGENPHGDGQRNYCLCD